MEHHALQTRISQSLAEREREIRRVQQLSFWIVAISLRAQHKSYSDFAPFQEALGVLTLSHS
jgi:hypothetical protein